MSMQNVTLVGQKSMNGSQQVKWEEPFLCAPSQEQKKAVSPKNRMWKGEQHMLYIVFLELNKEKAKSKLVRHSNNFFKQMAQFIPSKTQIQCRSHHHKYETKFKYPYRIIKEQKAKLEAQGIPYSQALSKYLPRTPTSSFSTNEGLNQEEDRQRSFASSNTAFSNCQTQLQGLNTIFMKQQDYERIFLMGVTGGPRYEPYHFHQMMWAQLMNPFGRF